LIVEVESFGSLDKTVRENSVLIPVVYQAIEDKFLIDQISTK